MLEQFEPRCFFHWFEQITRIPRPSFHEEQISDFLESFACERSLDYHRDQAGNILMRLPASPGYEGQPPLLLQSHTDIIAQKDEGVMFDFLTDPIQLVVEGDILRAKGTTLGADDAAGMAIMLAVADTPDLPHPPLELLFTVQEEVGMLGIQRFDFSLLQARRMINLDCGRMHNICVSSAGSVTLGIKEQLPCTGAGGALLSVTISGGLGGHSGLAIHLNRACAVNLMGELLLEVSRQIPLQLVSFETQGQPIFGQAQACLWTEPALVQTLCPLLEEVFARISQRYALTDPDLSCRLVLQEQSSAQALDTEDSLQLFRLFSLLPTEAKKRDSASPQILLSSAAISGAQLKEGQLFFAYTIRSVEDGEKARLSRQVQQVMSLLGFSPLRSKEYPGWPMQPQSPLVELFDRVHTRLFGAAPGHQFIHGGVETGVLKGAIPQMDAVGLIPSMENAHTTRELLYIDQVFDFWRLITAVLAEKNV